MSEIENMMRQSIASHLPDVMECAFLSYKDFAMETATQNREMQTPEFKAYHDACKGALANIKQIIELTKWAGTPDAAEPEGKDEHYLLKVIENGQKELDAIEGDKIR